MDEDLFAKAIKSQEDEEKKREQEKNKKLEKELKKISEVRKDLEDYTDAFTTQINDLVKTAKKEISSYEFDLDDELEENRKAKDNLLFKIEATKNKTNIIVTFSTFLSGMFLALFFVFAMKQYEFSLFKKCALFIASFSFIISTYAIAYMTQKHLNIKHTMAFFEEKEIVQNERLKMINDISKKSIFDNTYFYFYCFVFMVSYMVLFFVSL